MGREGGNEREQVRKEKEEKDEKRGIKQESSHLGGNQASPLECHEA